MILKKHQLEDVYKVFEANTLKYPNIIWEYEEFSKMIVSDVNNFINIKKDGSVKRKGSFKIPFNEYGKREIPLGDSCNFLIVPIALNEYFVNGVPIEDTIRNHKNIHNFCASKKVSKKFDVYWNGKKQQQLNRFYATNRGKGAYLYRYNGTKYHHLLGESSVQLLNTIEDFPNDINYQFYINKAQKVIDTLEPKQMLLF